MNEHPTIGVSGTTARGLKECLEGWCRKWMALHFLKLYFQYWMCSDEVEKLVETAYGQQCRLDEPPEWNEEKGVWIFKVVPILNHSNHKIDDFQSDLIERVYAP